MRWTLGEMMSAATARIGHRSDLDASTVSFWVNQAIEDVALEVPHGALERITVASTISGENRLTLPGDFSEVITLAYLDAQGSHGTLRRQDEQHVDAAGTGSGQPSHYVLFQDHLQLWPSPSSAWSLQLRYRAYPQELSALTHEAELAPEWRMAALLRTEQYLHEYLGNDDAAAVAAVRYLQRVNSIKDSIAKRQASRDMRASIAIRPRRRH